MDSCWYCAVNVEFSGFTYTRLDYSTSDNTKSSLLSFATRRKDVTWDWLTSPSVPYPLMWGQKAESS
jgi:hypothetical protein